MAQKSSALITLKNAGLNRGQRWIVRGVDLAVSRGEIVTLIGPNGAGKSTVAKIAIGLERPDEGFAYRTTGLKIAYVPQKLSIDWTLPMTVARFMSLTDRISKRDADEALERVGIPHLTQREVRNLSGGEFQRALLARAITRKPDLLVLDEPVQGVDFAGEIELYDLIIEIRTSLNCGVLMISHDLHVVMAETDHVVCLNGHVCCQGHPHTVAESQEYRALFGDRTSKALAVYEHKHDHAHLPDGIVRHLDGSLTEHCHLDDGHHRHPDQKD